MSLTDVPQTVIVVFFNSKFNHININGNCCYCKEKGNCIILSAPPQYTMNLYGVYDCPEHGELNPRQCETLAKTLGLNYGSELTGGMVTWKNIPYMCSRTLNRLFWNTNANGNGNSDFTPVCKYGKNNE